jgi:hypothetical protein
VVPVDLDQRGRDELIEEFNLKNIKSLPAMVETLTPRFLDRRTIDKAYLLVRNIVPGMTAARWTQFVRPHLVPRSPAWPRGVITI